MHEVGAYRSRNRAHARDVSAILSVFFVLFWESVQIKDRLRSDDVIWSGAIDSE